MSNENDVAEQRGASAKSFNDEPQNSAISSTTPTSTNSTTKEKKSWFHSLTRRKKTQSQNSLTTAAPSTAALSSPTSDNGPQLQNNNNEPLHVLATGSHHAATGDGAAKSVEDGNRKRKDEKNVFQRFRKRVEIKFNSLRHRHNTLTNDAGGASGTTDASAEFLTHSPIREPQLTFSFTSSTALEGPETVSFTHDYKRFIVKKWLEREDSEPNRIMYKASSEMLNQVWYWGEISRRDAQKQLTDKPTGSFLVRDSETSGCQFTLSFRLVNVTLHYRLEYRNNYWHFEELQYESIVEMIEDILYRCTNDNFVCFVKVPNEMQPPFPVILKYPLSRYLKMPHLQDLCRRVIQRYATPEEIAKLPIPPKLHEYLSEKRELVFQS